MEKVYVIIPCHNQLNDLKKCLQSLYRQSYSNIFPVVVDDGSNDGTEEYLNSLKKKNKPIKIVKGNGDLWWGGSVCKGYEMIKDQLQSNDYILLVNSDVILEKECIKKLLNFAKSQGNNIIVHALTVDYEDKETIISSGSIIKSWLFFLTVHPLRGKTLSEIKDYSLQPIKIHTVPARCLLIPKKVIDKVGFIDAKLFKHYGGDSDFGVRCYKKGFQPFILPSAICYLNKYSTGISPETNYVSLFKQIKGLFLIKSSNNLLVRWRFGRNAPIYIRSFYYIFVTLKVLFSIFFYAIKFW